ncbi:MAG: carboxynorspermidine decarboxylase [Candidatus Aureabacteria bacterium]|nr:carboxynorspermidine decarboxylase [Candidatus Auribacterota bacterium]
MSLDLSNIETPVYILEEALLKRNLQILDRVQKESGAKILLALKGFAFWSSFRRIRKVLKGATASSLNELKLAHDEMRGECHIYSVAYSEKEFSEILRYADHVIFNSFSQWRRFKPRVERARKSGKKIECGIRINPEQSEVKTPLYDPCGKHSRLGVTLSEFREDDLEGISGLHFHIHCENSFDVLERNLKNVEERFGQYFSRMKWINFGGGHLVTGRNYHVDALISLIKDFRSRYKTNVYLEPGSAVGWQTGTLVASVLDLIHNEMDIAILDTSVSAHMPDCLEMPYRPEIRGADLPGKSPYTYRLGGITCLAGDVIGDYSFSKPLQIGDKLIFEDMIHYTIVKNTTFNGVSLPSLAILSEKGIYNVVRRFGYHDYKFRNG